MASRLGLGPAQGASKLECLPCTDLLLYVRKQFDEKQTDWRTDENGWRQAKQLVFLRLFIFRLSFWFRFIHRHNVDAEHYSVTDC